jgi:hypothetical protein
VKGTITVIGFEGKDWLLEGLIERKKQIKKTVQNLKINRKHSNEKLERFCTFIKPL